ncbi:MAG: hypothetical protein ACR2KL_06515 [Nocardioidaceae bacterium]
MSGLDVLREVLTEHAEGLPQRPLDARLSDVRGKVRVRNRARTGVVGVLGALAVAALVTVAPGSGIPPGGPADVPSAPASGLSGAPVPIVADSGIDMYATPGTATLIGHRFARAGQQQPSFSFTATSGDLAWTLYCAGPPGEPSAANPYLVAVTVNGHPLGSSSCAGGNPSVLGADGVFAGPYAKRVTAWHGLGVERGQPVHVSVQLREPGRGPAVDPAVTIGAAFYAVSDNEVVEQGIVLPRIEEYEGVNYRLLATRVQPVSQGRRLQVPVPAADTQLLVSWGYAGSPGAYTFERDGHGVSGFSGASRAGGSAALLTRTGGTSTVGVSADRSAASSTRLFLAFYAPVN